MNKFFNLEWSAIGASVIAFFTSFFAPIAPFLILVLALVTADLFTAINAAKIKGEIIRSFGIRRTVGKILMYWVVIISSEVLVLMTDLMTSTYEFTNKINIIFLTYMVVVLIAYAEYKSIVENVEKGTGVSLWPQIKNVIRDLLRIKK